MNTCHLLLIATTCLVAGCLDGTDTLKPESATDTTTAAGIAEPAVVKPASNIIDSEANFLHADPDSLVSFARTLIGTPYLYASVDPAKGFDCSGFITYIFTHFGMKVPRSSVDFTDYGRPVSVAEAKPGDLILFTGTDPSDGIVGHMGLVERNGEDQLYFIHSSSGKANGVVITPLNDHYKERFVKIIRVFPDERFDG
jgi:cell wall-associated NlpC family hydrolase